MNGGVKVLSWVIESTDFSLTPDKCAEWLEGRLPRPWTTWSNGKSMKDKSANKYAKLGL